MLNIKLIIYRCHIKNGFQLVPGPPFVFGALLVICALLVAAFIPDESNPMATGPLHHHSSTSRRPSGKYAYQKCTLQVFRLLLESWMHKLLVVGLFFSFRLFTCGFHW